MIRHMVLFKLTNPSEALVSELCALIRSMEGRVPMLRGLEVGADILHSPRSYDICLQVLLDDRAALDAYQQDPYHSGVVKKRLGEVSAASVAIDYEV